ncbi:hypothetical protein OA067_02990 [Gammaproteobacteria bacterium]|nr:hypothetical protein [Gammaproteobacteria bacterium]
MKSVIYGNGTISKILFQFLKRTYQVECFTVQSDLITGKRFEGLPIFPFETIERSCSPKDYAMFIAVGYGQMNLIRKQKFLEAKSRGYHLPNYVHHSVDLHENTFSGEGNIVLDHVSLQPGVRIGDNNFIWSNAVVGHGAEIQNDCWITSGVTIGGDSKVKSGCFLGINATIGHNIVLETDSFIGANCLIARNTEPGSAYVSPGALKHRLDSRRFLDFAGV